MGLSLYVVRGESMRPTLAPGDALLVGGVGQGGTLRRGEVVAVREPAGRAGEYLKRIVGLPREEGACCGSGLGSA